MVHTPQELGSLKDALITARRERYGEQRTKKFFDEVDWYWREVERRIQKAGLSQPETVSHLHIFVDGLPDTDEARVETIVQELTALNIPAYSIIKNLKENGAKVHGTEDVKLLLQEHQYWVKASQGKKQNPAIAQRLLEARDQAIARCIDTVVPEGEIGLLFLGRAHNVVGELGMARKFKIVYF